MAKMARHAGIDVWHFPLELIPHLRFGRANRNGGVGKMEVQTHDEMCIHKQCDARAEKDLAFVEQARALAIPAAKQPVAFCATAVAGMLGR